MQLCRRDDEDDRGLAFAQELRWHLVEDLVESDLLQLGRYGGARRKCRGRIGKTPDDGARGDPLDAVADKVSLLDLDAVNDRADTRSKDVEGFERTVMIPRAGSAIPVLEDVSRRRDQLQVWKHVGRDQGVSVVRVRDDVLRAVGCEGSREDVGGEGARNFLSGRVGGRASGDDAEETMNRSVLYRIIRRKELKVQEMDKLIAPPEREVNECRGTVTDEFRVSVLSRT